MKKQVVFAVGGTGGHVFPAQTLALQMLAENPDTLLTFMGAGLRSNPYFKKNMFSSVEVASGTFKKHPFALLRSLFFLCKGVGQSLAYFIRHRPRLVVGFGSFHAFPPLCAALILRIPYVLFESNSIPGTVVKLFSKWALMTGVQFIETKAHLFGKADTVKMPLARVEKVDVRLARLFFHLHEERFTFLVFGGSQGSDAVSRIFCDALNSLNPSHFQVIHLAGSKEMKQNVEERYRLLGICACVKEFEENMGYAWTAADLAVCRGGAMTLAEMVEYEVPALIIPFPQAAKNHQVCNAQLMEKMGGAIYFPQQGLPQHFSNVLKELLYSNKLSEMKNALKAFKKQENRRELNLIIHEELQK